jgi:DNA-binding transcriptional ArsR family regulator
MKAKKSPGARPASHKPMEQAQLSAVAELFALLSEPSRLRILQALQSGPLSVGELVRQTDLKQANVSRQLGTLLSAGIIARRADGNFAIYSISMPMVFDLCEIVCKGVAELAAERAAALQR